MAERCFRVLESLSCKDLMNRIESINQSINGTVLYYSRDTLFSNNVGFMHIFTKKNTSLSAQSLDILLAPTTILRSNAHDTCDDNSHSLTQL